MKIQGLNRDAMVTAVWRDTRRLRYQTEERKWRRGSG